MSSSSMNPRKFSEKIEIHKKKISEETAAFEKIMAEVQMVKHDGNARSQHVHQPTGLLPPMYYPRSGSLPNVHTAVANPTLAEMHPNYNIQPGPSLMDDRSGGNTGAIHPSRNANRSPAGHYHPYPRNSSPNFRQISPIRGQVEAQMAMINNGGMYFQQHPSSASYLLPVPDGNWRRVSSDPGIHASLQTSPQQLNGGGGQSSHSTPTPSPPMNRSPPALTASQGHLDQQQQLMRTQSRPLPQSQDNYAELNLYHGDSQGVQSGRVANSPGSLSDCSPTSNNYSIPGSEAITDDGQCYAGSYQSNAADIQGHNIPYSMGLECSQGTAYPPSYIHLISQQHQRSSPGSPGSASTSVSMQQQIPYPPGFSAIAAQMQNISIDHRNIQNLGNSGQLSGVQSNPYYAGQTSRGDGNVQQGMMDPSTYNYMIQQQQYSTAVPEMMQTPSPGSVNSHQDVSRRRSYQPMSPDSSQIPNIVLTNFDGAVVRSPYDQSLDCEDLKEQMALGDLSPADLSALQYETGRDFSIDAATEDALRHDRL